MHLAVVISWERKLVTKQTTGIQRRVGKKGVTYRVEVCVGRKRVSRSFKRKSDAVAWKRQTELAMQEGTWLRNRKAQRHTFAELVDRFVELENPDRNYRTHFLWWKETLGHLRLIEIDSVDIEDRIRILQSRFTPSGKSLSMGTVNRYIASLSVLYTAAVRWKWVTAHPMLNKQIRRPQEPKGRVRCLTDSERERLLATCKSDSAKLLYPLVIMALATGARAGELLSLRWIDIDFHDRTAIAHQTKNGDRRLLPLSETVIKELHELSFVRRIDTDLVFPSKEGTSPWHYRKPWLRALDRAEVNNFRFHDLRHSCASYLAMNGATLNDLKAILGHRTLAMVQRYAHLNEQYVESVVRDMNERVLGL